MADQHEETGKTKKQKKVTAPPSLTTQPIWLFKKKLNRADATDSLQQLVVEECSDAMKTAVATLLEERISDYVVVIAGDPEGNCYELRFTHYAGGTHILFHNWGYVIAVNSLKEGDTVEAWGTRVSEDSGGIYFTCTLDIHRQNQESERVPMEEDGDEKNLNGGVTNPRERKEPVFLFEKKMVHADTDGDLDLQNCSVKLREELRKTADVRVFIKDPSKKVYQVRFVSQGSSYALCNGWERMVTENGLEAGDTVAGYGDIISHGKFKVLLYILRNEKKNFEGEEIKVTSVPFLLFKKESLVSEDVDSARLVIEKCKAVEEIVEREEKLKEYGGFVRFKADDTNGVEYELRLSRYTRKGKYILHHQWRKVVAANGLKSGDGVSCWGVVAEDGSIRMTIDVHNDQALQDVADALEELKRVVYAFSSTDQ